MQLSVFSFYNGRSLLFLLFVYLLINTGRIYLQLEITLQSTLDISESKIIPNY